MNPSAARHPGRRRRGASRGRHSREPRSRGLSHRNRARRARGARAHARRAVRPHRARRHDAEHGWHRALRAAAPRRPSDAGAVPHGQGRRRGSRARLRSRRRRLSAKPFHLQGAAAARRGDPAPQQLVSGERRVALEFGGNTIDFKTYEARAWDGSRARADAQGSDDPEGAVGRARANRHARGDTRPRLGVRGVSRRHARSTTSSCACASASSATRKRPRTSTPYAAWVTASRQSRSRPNRRASERTDAANESHATSCC